MGLLRCAPQLSLVDLMSLSEVKNSQAPQGPVHARSKEAEGRRSGSLRPTAELSQAPPHGNRHPVAQASERKEAGVHERQQDQDL
jgi:hypothetical protein